MYKGNGKHTGQLNPGNAPLEQLEVVEFVVVFADGAFDVTLVEPGDAGG